MATIPGVESKDAGLFVRLVYWFTKRRLGQIIEPISVTAHHPRLLRALAAMETGQQAAKSVEPGLKNLASLKVALQIGCAQGWADSLGGERVDIRQDHSRVVLAEMVIGRGGEKIAQLELLKEGKLDFPQVGFVKIYLGHRIAPVN